jgi:hypothetical protein
MNNSKIMIKDQALVNCEAFLLIRKEMSPIMRPIDLLYVICRLVRAPQRTPVKME